MRLKSFYARTTTEAMQMVRETLGEDAVIVATREEKGGKAVRVTAAVEQHDPYDDELLAQHDPDYSANWGAQDDMSQDFGADWQYELEEDEDSAVLEKLTDAMIRHAVPEEITDQVISCATVIGLEQTDIALLASIEHLFSFRPLSQKQKGSAQMLVGPPGAGKTLATAKLAARAVMNDESVAVITTDTIRAGGVEQLAAFTKLMKLNLMKAGNPKQLAACLDQAQGADRIFIDTAGLNPYDNEAMRHLARLLAAGDIEPVLAMPAGTDAEESGDMGRIYSTLGVRYMLPTRLDIARRLGGLLSAAHYGSLVFSDASNSPKVAEGLFGLSPKRLSHLLMPEVMKTPRKQTQRPRQKETVQAG